jgi:hypothetical protein
MALVLNADIGVWLYVAFFYLVYPNFQTSVYLSFIQYAGKTTDGRNAIATASNVVSK